MKWNMLTNPAALCHPCCACWWITRSATVLRDPPFHFSYSQKSALVNVLFHTQSHTHTHTHANSDTHTSISLLFCSASLRASLSFSACLRAKSNSRCMCLWGGGGGYLSVCLCDSLQMAINIMMFVSTVRFRYSHVRSLKCISRTPTRRHIQTLVDHPDVWKKWKPRFKA